MAASPPEVERSPLVRSHEWREVALPSGVRVELRATRRDRLGVLTVPVLGMTLGSFVLVPALLSGSASGTGRLTAGVVLVVASFFWMMIAASAWEERQCFELGPDRFERYQTPRRERGFSLTRSTTDVVRFDVGEPQHHTPRRGASYFTHPLVLVVADAAPIAMRVQSAERADVSAIAERLNGLLDKVADHR